MRCWPADGPPSQALVEGDGFPVVRVNGQFNAGVPGCLKPSECLKEQRFPDALAPQLRAYADITHLGYGFAASGYRLDGREPGRGSVGSPSDQQECPWRAVEDALDDRA
jgi:hypothetical protein